MRAMKYLTVILANEMPMLTLQEPVQYRSVQIELTPEQQEKIAPRFLGKAGDRPVFERVRMCFLEEREVKDED